MTVDFAKRVSFVREAQENGVETAAEAVGLSEETAREVWEWYQTEVCYPTVHYQCGSHREVLQPTEADGPDLETLGLVVSGVSHVRFRGQAYSVEREGVYRFAVIPETVRCLISLPEERPLIPLLRALACVQIHGNRYDGESVEQLKERLLREPWLSITCGTIAGLSVSILQEERFRARRVGALTLDEWNTYDNGHALLEVFDPEAGKWMLADVDMGLLFRKGETFLSAYEFWQAVARDEQPEFFVLSDKEIDPFFMSPGGFNYSLWMRWKMRDEGGTWDWYRHIFQVPCIIREGAEDEPTQRVYFGPEEPLREYFGEDEAMVIMEEGEWVEELYGGR